MKYNKKTKQLAEHVCLVSEKLIVLNKFAYECDKRADAMTLISISLGYLSRLKKKMVKIYDI